jgi:hypothetical protein
MRPLLPSLRDGSAILAHWAERAPRSPASMALVARWVRAMPLEATVWCHPTTGERYAVCSGGSCPSQGAAQPIARLGYRHDTCKVKYDADGRPLLPVGRIWVTFPGKGAAEVSEQAVWEAARAAKQENPLLRTFDAPFRYAQNRCKDCKNVHGERPVDATLPAHTPSLIATLTLLSVEGAA